MRSSIAVAFLRTETSAYEGIHVYFLDANLASEDVGEGTPDVVRGEVAGTYQFIGGGGVTLGVGQH